MLQSITAAHLTRCRNTRQEADDQQAAAAIMEYATVVVEPRTHVSNL
jgi:hypothetical protein